VEITEVRIKLMEESGERLKAFCSVTFDNCFVVRDLKIIEGTSGSFVAMPSRKLTSHCPQCATKNHLRAQHCNQCGASLDSSRMSTDHEGRAKLYADIAHPINSTCREMIQESVVREFHEELRRAKDPNYVSRYEDFDLDFEEPRSATPQKRAQETRVDPPHEPRGKHAPRTGGSAESTTSDGQGPRAPLSSTSKAHRDGPEASFGTGVFSEE